MTPPAGGGCEDERGVALPLALFALAMLAGLLVVLLSVAGMEPTIAATHNEVVRVRYLADAGIEWAYDALAATPNWSTVLATNNGQMATNMPLPGLPATSGTFSVTVRNDTQPGDAQITGEAVDSGGAAADTNGVVVVTSTGTYNGVTRQLQTVIRRLQLPPVVAALAFPGTEADVAFTGNSFTVNGQDVNLNDTPGGCAPVWGIAVAGGNAANEAEVERSLSRQQRDNVIGKDGTGNSTISQDPTLTPAQIAKFVSLVKDRADHTFTSTQADPLSFTNIGSTCATDPGSLTCWGTRSQPKIVYVKGDLDPTASFVALRIAGTSTGAGILIVEDGDVLIRGNFRWDGLIIVTGQWGGINYGGGGWQSVYGTVIANETATVPGPGASGVAGNAKISYSCEAIGMAGSLRALFTTSSWREI